MAANTGRLRGAAFQQSRVSIPSAIVETKNNGGCQSLAAVSPATAALVVLTVKVEVPGVLVTDTVCGEKVQVTPVVAGWIAQPSWTSCWVTVLEVPGNIGVTVILDVTD